MSRNVKWLYVFIVLNSHFFLIVPCVAQTDRVVSLVNLFEKWSKFCDSDQGVCYTTMDFKYPSGTEEIVSVAVFDNKEQGNKIFKVLLPDRLQIQPGIKLSSEEGDIINLEFETCFGPDGMNNDKSTANMCAAQGETLIDPIKRASFLNLRVMNQGNKEVDFRLPMDGFARAFDGPPTQ